MSLTNTQDVNVLNYNTNDVFASSSKDSYRFAASRDGIHPSVTPVNFSELQNISSNTSVITQGWLTFDDDIKEEVYLGLRIHNWKDILTNDEIEDILLNPTLKGIQKIIFIDNQTYYERVRMIMFKLISDGKDVSTKINRIVEQRYEELKNRQRKTSIVLTERDTSKDTYANRDEVKELSEQNINLQKQLDEMKLLMEQMLQNQNNSNSENNSQKNTNVDVKEKSTKKAGRPKKNL